MKKLLKYYANSLKEVTKSLEKQSIFLNKPWALIDEDGETQKLIFSKGGRLVMSKNGRATEGSWEYFAEAKAMLLDRGGDKVLLSEQYIDENVLILKVDGTGDTYFPLANENSLPDHDIVGYLHAKRMKEYKIREIPLFNGNRLQIQNASMISTSEPYLYLNKEVELVDRNKNSFPIKKAVFVDKSKAYTFYVKDGQVKKVVPNLIINSLDGRSFEIEGGKAYNIAASLGKRITLNGEQVDLRRIVDENQTCYYLNENRIEDIKFIRQYELTNDYIITIEQINANRTSRGDVLINCAPVSRLPDGTYRVKNRLKWLKVENSKVA